MTDLRQSLIRSLAEEGGAVRAVPFNPDAHTFAAYKPGGKLGDLNAATLDQATAEATERWNWDRGDRLLIRETGQEDAPTWPFAKQQIDRLHVYAVRRSAPIAWRPTADLMRTKPVYRYKLELICSVDLRVLLA